MIFLITITISVTGVVREKNEYDKNLFNTQSIISNNIYRSENLNNLDYLDQYYTNHAYSLNIADTPYAQTFKPSYSTITRIEILLDKEGWPTDYGSYWFKLMSGVPGGTVSKIWATSFASVYPSDGVDWYEIDFPDQCVLPGATYHILIYGNQPSEYTKTLGWCYGQDEPYTNGDAYYYINSEWKIFQVEGTPCDFCFKTYGTDLGGNHAPVRPSAPSGPSTGIIGTTYTYSTSSTDADGDKIYYGWDWDGDRVVDDWSADCDSGSLCLISHNWSETGTYQVRVRGCDSHGREGDWSDPLDVTMPKTYIYNPNYIITKALERFPLIGKILNQII